MGKQVDARLNGGIAQLGEHLPCKQGVASSNLAVSTDFERSRKKREAILLKLARSASDCTLKTEY